MFVGQLDFRLYLVSRTLDEGDLMDNQHGRLDSVIGTVNSKRKVFETDIGARVGTDIGEHGPNVLGRWYER